MLLGRDHNGRLREAQAGGIYLREWDELSHVRCSITSITSSSKCHLQIGASSLNAHDATAVGGAARSGARSGKAC
jgi:hypothetical protein